MSPLTESTERQNSLILEDELAEREGGHPSGEPSHLEPCLRQSLAGPLPSGPGACWKVLQLCVNKVIFPRANTRTPSNEASAPWVRRERHAAWELEITQGKGSLTCPISF